MLLLDNLAECHPLPVKFKVQNSWQLSFGTSIDEKLAYCCFDPERE